jgi:hypothetical protein
VCALGVAFTALEVVSNSALNSPLSKYLYIGFLPSYFLNLLASTFAISTSDFIK